MSSSNKPTIGELKAARKLKLQQEKEAKQQAWEAYVDRVRVEQQRRKILEEVQDVDFSE